MVQRGAGRHGFGVVAFMVGVAALLAGTLGLVSPAPAQAATIVAQAPTGNDYPWQSANPNSMSPLRYNYRNCTDFVAWRLNKQAGRTSAPWAYTWGNLTPRGGHAYQWDDYSHRADNTPALGAVAFWSSGQFGHVAIVSAIWSDGRVDIEEYNNTPYAYTKRSRVVAEKYLHIHDLPSTPPPPPDRDGDGVPNDNDRCPDAAGPGHLQGCPDRDGDGVADPDDRCPAYAGQPSNRGCPTGNFLRNSSLEEGSVAGWGRGNGVASNLAAYRSGTRGVVPREGDWFGATNAQVGGSVAQEIGITDTPGKSYTFSVWLRSSTSQPFSGRVALWALGGEAESGGTNFTVGPQWTLVSTSVNIARGGHTQLKPEIYESTTGQDLYFDGAQVVDSGLRNSSLEEGSVVGWGRGNSIASNLAAYRSGTRGVVPREGDWFGATNAQVGGSVAQEFGITDTPGKSYTFSVWLRSSTSQPFSGRVALWALGGEAESGGTNFTVGPQWTLVSTSVNIARGGHTQLKPEIYESTTGQDLYFDGAQVVDSGLRNSSLEEGSVVGWGRGNGVAANLAAYRSGTRGVVPWEGDWFGATNAQVGGSVAQEFGITDTPGKSYTFSVWLRSSTSQPFSGRVALWALGGEAESGGTNFTVGPQWTLVSTSVNIARGGHTQLKPEIYESTTGQDLYFDGASLAAGNAQVLAPSAPSISRATVGDRSASVVFVAPSSDGGSPISNYQYSLDGGATWRTRSPAAVSSPLVISGLSNGVSYRVVVRAVNAVGAGAPSGVVSVVPRAPVAPGAPTGVVAKAGNKSASIAFVAPASNGGAPISNFQYSLDDGKTWRVRGPASVSSPLLITGLVNGTTYRVKVRAVNAVGTGAPSVAVVVKPAPQPPSAPNGLVAKAGDRSASIAFAAPASNGGAPISTYQYSLDDGKTWRVRTPASTSSPLVITGLVNGTTYRVKVRAVNTVGAGAPSAVVVVKPAPQPPGAPTGLRASVGSGWALVSFTAPSVNGGAPVSNYQYSVDGGVSWKVVSPVSVRSPILVAPLSNGRTYQVRLRAVNSAGPGAPSTAVAVTPRA